MCQTTPSTGANPPDEPPHGQTDGTTPRAGTPTAAPSPGPATAGPRRPTTLVVALALAVAVIAALIAVVLWPDDEADHVTGPTATTEAPATTATERSTTQVTEPSTTAPPTTTAPVDTSTAVFPIAASRGCFADPVDAARAFAADFVGFTDPLAGEFTQGGARSGEVEVRPTADGPVTTVFVRQLGTDDSWWILGSATAKVTTDVPGPGDAITSPVTVSGSALAFERTVAVEVGQDGAGEPLGIGFVTGGGDVSRPFSGQITFSPPTADHGALVFLTWRQDDGRVWEASGIPVRFP